MPRDILALPAVTRRGPYKRYSSSVTALRSLRLLHGIGQAELAEMLGMNTMQFHRIETGKSVLCAHALVTLAEMFDVHPRDLLPGLRKHSAGSRTHRDESD